MKYYGVAIVPATAGFGEWERSLYGGDYGRTIKETLAKATAGEHDPQTHAAFLLGRDNEKLASAWDASGHHGDIRGLIHDEPNRVYAVETIYGIRYVGLQPA